MVFIKAGKKVIYTTKKGLTISTPKKKKARKPTSKRAKKKAK